MHATHTQCNKIICTPESPKETFSQSFFHCCWFHVHYSEHDFCYCVYDVSSCFFWLMENLIRFSRYVGYLESFYYCCHLGISAQVTWVLVQHSVNFFILVLWYNNCITACFNIYSSPTMQVNQHLITQCSQLCSYNFVTVSPEPGRSLKLSLRKGKGKSKFGKQRWNC